MKYTWSYYTQTKKDNNKNNNSCGNVVEMSFHVHQSTFCNTHSASPFIHSDGTTYISLYPATLAALHNISFDNIEVPIRPVVTSTSLANFFPLFNLFLFLVLTPLPVPDLHSLGRMNGLSPLTNLAHSAPKLTLLNPLTWHT